MQITVTFESLEEMKQFTETVKIEKSETGGSQTVNSAPVAPIQQTAPTTPVQNPAPTAGVPEQTGAVPTNPAPASTPATGMPAQSAPVPAAPASPTVPTATSTYTADDLARAAMVLMDSGRQIELINLLAQFGAASITELKPNQFGAFATALRGLGAQI